MQSLQTFINNFRANVELKSDLIRYVIDEIQINKY